MSLYYRPQQFSGSHAGGGSSSSDASDGGTKLFENVLEAGHNIDTAATGATGFGYATASDSVACDRILPHPEIVGSTTDGVSQAAFKDFPGCDFMHDVFKNMLDMASQMTNPLGFLSAFFELLFGMLTTCAEELIEGLPVCEIYNIAAEASLDLTKRMAS